MSAQSPPVDDDMLTLTEVAGILRMHPSTVARHVKASGLPAIRIGQTYRFRRSAVERYLEESAVAGSTP